MAGSVSVDRLMEIERYSHVMHISSTVTGKLLPELGVWDVLRAALPAGTVSGAPKARRPPCLSAVSWQCCTACRQRLCSERRSGDAYAAFCVLTLTLVHPEMILCAVHSVTPWCIRLMRSVRAKSSEKRCAVQHPLLTHAAPIAS